MSPIRIERDLDCDCPRWLRWRVVERTDYGDQIHAHAITKVGARLKRRRIERLRDAIVV